MLAALTAFLAPYRDEAAAVPMIRQALAELVEHAGLRVVARSGPGADVVCD